jgi:hypothetical protein
MSASSSVDCDIVDSQSGRDATRWGAAAAVGHIAPVGCLITCQENGILAVGSADRSSETFSGLDATFPIISIAKVTGEIVAARHTGQHLFVSKTQLSISRWWVNDLRICV